MTTQAPINDFLAQRTLAVVGGECVMMFAQPIGFGHRMHRRAWGLLGKLPK